MKSIAQPVIVFAWIALLLPVTGSNRSNLLASRAAAQKLVLSARTDLVVLNVHVEDHRLAVPGLTANAFDVFEDGVRQTVSLFESQDTPVTAGVLIDNSSSMFPNRDRVIASALQFARLSNQQDELFVIHFNEHVRYGLPWDTPFTAELMPLQRALFQMTGLGKTALYDAIAEGLGHLEQGTRQRQALIIVSDGGDNASRRTLAEVLDRVRRSDVLIFSVIVIDESGSGANPRVLKQLATSSGGDVWVPRAVRDIQPAFEQIAADIRAGYTIGYVSTNPKSDGTFRKLRVVARGAKGHELSVRARSGYMATADAGGHE